MSSFFKKMTRLRHIREFWRIMSPLGLLQLARPDHAPGAARIYLRPISREVLIRRGTTDLKCLLKVFLSNEYHLPFEMSPRVIVDAGANIGMATLFFAARFPDACIVAIEPEASNFELLKQNCAGLSNVMLVQAALWPQEQRLWLSDSYSEEWAFQVATHASPASKNLGEVRAITIGQILRQLHTDRIDLLKLDIEGSEFELFSNNADQWLDHVRLIAIELHDCLRPGCAHAFYSALVSRRFVQEIRGENIFVKILGDEN
jgi:FkbM family methyltransferase